MWDRRWAIWQVTLEFLSWDEQVTTPTLYKSEWRQAFLSLMHFVSTYSKTCNYLREIDRHTASKESASEQQWLKNGFYLWNNGFYQVLFCQSPCFVCFTTFRALLWIIISIFHGSTFVMTCHSFISLKPIKIFHSYAHFKTEKK